MNLARKLVLSAAVAATTLAAIPAEAGERWHRARHGSNGDLLAAGIVGLAVGALAAGAIGAGREEPVYVNPYRHPRPQPDRDYVIDEPVDVVVDDLDEPSYEPWSRAWFRYCSERYRSFDPETGTYVGYDGRERFCETD